MSVVPTTLNATREWGYHLIGRDSRQRPFACRAPACSGDRRAMLITRHTGLSSPERRPNRIKRLTLAPFVAFGNS